MSETTADSRPCDNEGCKRSVSRYSEYQALCFQCGDLRVRGTTDFRCTGCGEPFGDVYCEDCLAADFWARD